MRRLSLCVLAVLVVSLFLALVPAGADVGFVYTCDELPAVVAGVQRWNVSPNGPPSTTPNCGGSCSGLSNSIVGGNGSNVWKCVDNSTIDCNMWKNANLNGVSFGTGITIAANIRCEANSANSSFTLGINWSGHATYFVCVRAGECLLENRDGAVVGSSNPYTPDTVGYHAYYLTAKNPPGVGDDQCVWTVYRDGNPIITATPGPSTTWNPTSGFFAGHGGPLTTNVGSGTGTWYFDWIACRTDGAFSPSQWDPMVPPLAPTVTAPANGSVVIVPNPTIQWTSDYYDSYEVHVNTTNNSADANGWDSDIVASTANSCTPADLLNGSYYVFVRLHTPMGWGAWSASGYSFTVNVPTSPPNAPTLTAPAPGSAFNTRAVVVRWTGGKRDGYEVHISTTNAPDVADGWDSGSVTNPSSDCLSGNLANGSYHAFARLFNLAGPGQWSAGVAFTVNVTEVLPGTPTVVTPTAGGNVALQQPVVRWIGGAHDKYEVHINTTNIAADADGWDSGEAAGADDWCDSGTLTNGTYHVFVREHNVAGWGDWSVGRAFTINFTGEEIKKGWIFLRDDQPYHLELLTHAREYHVNHLQISHDIMMYAWQPINNVARRDRINELIDTAHANGIGEVVLWVHDFQWTSMPTKFLVGGKTNLDDPDFWIWLDGVYEQLFTVCPNADGIVVTYSENWKDNVNLVGGADPNDRSLTIHTGKTPTDTFAQDIQTLWNVCNRHHKSLYIRTWGADKWIRDGLLRCDPAIWMMNKATGPGDWNMIQEDYSIMGTATGHPEMEEFDFAGEYWGLTYTPWAGVDFMKHLWSDFGLSRGVKGMAARIDRDNGNVIQTPNRINLCALDILADYPDCPSEDIYNYWSNHWFGASGSKVASSLKRTLDITNACYSLPTIYPTSYWVASNDTKASTFDLDCVSASLKANTTYQSGVTAYDLFRGRMENAAAKLPVGVPSTLLGDFTPAHTNQINPTCSATAVDALVGLDPLSFTVEYSTDAGSSWTSIGFTATAEGASTNPYHITANSVPFGQLRAGNNKMRFAATNLMGESNSQTFTARGLDTGYATLGDSIVTDGVYYMQGGDGDTSPATRGERSCRTPTNSGDYNFYFQTDEGFAYDKSPGNIYLQVDYYGSSGSIMPCYDSIWRRDEPLPPVYLSGGTTWRTATWTLDYVNFGHRLNGWLDIGLYTPGGFGNVFISGVRLSYSPPAGILAQPEGLTACSTSPTSATIAWSPVPGATKYQVCRGGGFVGWATTPRFTDNGLIPNTQYAYAVTAFDASDHTSCASRNAYVTTLPAAITPTTITSSPLPGTWQISGSFTFTATGGFGPGKATYYQYTWDRSPRHVWSGYEWPWPAGAGSPPTGTGWSVWKPTSSPVNSASWLLYEGDTEQRCMSTETVLENGIPTWILNDQGRVANTKAKLGLWPNMSPASRSAGVTVVARMRCVDEPSGWYNTSMNFGLNLTDSPDVGISVTPDSLQLGGDAWQPYDNGYSYHTYYLTLKNSTYSLYRDGSFVSSMVQGASGSSTWAGPFFGHWRSDATGGWAWQWIAWNNTGDYVPSSSATLNMTASQFGSSYYLHIRGFNADGVPDAGVDVGPYYYWNGSTPVNPTVVDDGDYTTASVIHATWSPIGPSVDHYEVGIGTAAGLADVRPFSNVGISYEINATGLTLLEGHTYYVTVKGVFDSAYYTGYSNGIIVAPTNEKIADAKILADGAPVALYAKAVTAILPDCAYIQDANGMGIKVITTRPMVAGYPADLAGKLAGSDGERYLKADAVQIWDETPPVPPPGLLSLNSQYQAQSNSELRVDVPALSISTRHLGGSSFGAPNGQVAVKAYQWQYDRAQHKLVRSSVPLDVPGLNNMGALVRCYGRVRSSGVNSFYLDDGSAFDDYYDTSRDGPAGVKVTVPDGVTPPAEGSFVSVTGISSCYQSLTDLCRSLRVRTVADIEKF